MSQNRDKEHENEESKLGRETLRTHQTSSEVLPRSPLPSEYLSSKFHGYNSDSGHCTVYRAPGSFLSHGTNRLYVNELGDFQNWDPLDGSPNSITDKQAGILARKVLRHPSASLSSDRIYSADTAREQRTEALPSTSLAEVRYPQLPQLRVQDHGTGPHMQATPEESDRDVPAHNLSPTHLQPQSQSSEIPTAQREENPFPRHLQRSFTDKPAEQIRTNLRGLPLFTHVELPDEQNLDEPQSSQESWHTVPEKEETAGKTAPAEETIEISATAAAACEDGPPHTDRDSRPATGKALVTLIHFCRSGESLSQIRVAILLPQAQHSRFQNALQEEMKGMGTAGK